MYWSKNKLKFVLLLFFASNILISSKQLLANSKDIAPPSKKKIALIIGNADYKGARLRNPIQDAKDVYKADLKIAIDNDVKAALGVRDDQKKLDKQNKVKNQKITRKI